MEGLRQSSGSRQITRAQSFSCWLWVALMQVPESRCSGWAPLRKLQRSNLELLDRSVLCRRTAVQGEKVGIEVRSI